MQPEIAKTYTTESLSSEVILNEAIQDLRKRLTQSVWNNRKQRTPWEVCVCALALTLEPEGGWRRLSDSLPYGLREYGMDEFLDTISHFGYLARPAYLSVKDIDERLMPCLLVAENGNRPYIVISAEHI